MEPKQNCNRNQERSNHNSNSSSPSNYRNSSDNGITIVADQVMNSVRDRMLNSVAIPGNLTDQRDLLIPERNRMLYVEIQETIAEQFHQVDRNLTRNVEIREHLIEHRDRVSEWAMTIQGCEYLRSLVAAEDGGVRETLLAIVGADLPILSVHETGFLFVRALFLSCDEHQMNTVLDSVLVGNNSFPDICNNYYGSETVKILIYNLKTEAQIAIITNVLEAHISFFTNYVYSRNVLVYFIYTCNHNFSRKRLFDAMANNCLAIAMNELGNTVLRCSISPMFVNDHLVLSLLNTIVANVFVLAKDIYGNYLIQHVIDSNIEGVTEQIVEALMGRFCDLAMSQFGNIVVQKCLKNSKQIEVVNIVEEFTNSPQLLAIAQDYLGCCVLLCALDHACIPGTKLQYFNLARSINLHVSALQCHNIGSIVLEKIKELNRTKNPFLFPQ